MFLKLNGGRAEGARHRACARTPKPEHRPLDGTAPCYLPCEIAWDVVKVMPPRAPKAFHVYCSKLNQGAESILEEVNRVLGEQLQPGKITYTNDASCLPQCEKIMVYLNEATVCLPSHL